MPLVIGLTGSIASGKSLVLRTLAELGAETCDADLLIRRMFEPGRASYGRIVAEFGPGIVLPDGTIDRRALGNQVFGNPEAMARLSRAQDPIVPAIKQEIQHWRETLPEDATGVMEAVLLIEADIPAVCDVTWLVACEDDTALRRLMARNDLSEEEARKRLASQISWREREGAADLVLHNDDTPEELQAAIRREFARLWEQRRQGALPPPRFGSWREAHPRPPQQARAAGSSAQSQ